MCSTELEKLFLKLKERSVETEKGCLIWLGATSRKGYGQITYKNETKLIHRMIYMSFTCTTPEIVMHSCDTPACWNFKHLIGGTHQDNMDDKVLKNRQYKGPGPRGIINGNSKLDDEKVRQIRGLADLSTAELANRFNISMGTVSMVRNHKIWKHVQ